VRIPQAGETGIEPGHHLKCIVNISGKPSYRIEVKRTQFLDGTHEDPDEDLEEVRAVDPTLRWIYRTDRVWWLWTAIKSLVVFTALAVESQKAFSDVESPNPTLKP